MAHTEATNLRVYWITWGVLLCITVMMLVLDGSNLSPTPFVALMLGAMAMKATLIGGNFMHLRHERAELTATVVIGIFAFGLLLYVLIAPDAARIHEMVVNLP